MGVRNTTHIIITGIVMVYIISLSQPLLLLGAFVLVTVALVLNRYIAKFTAEAKRKRIELIREADRHIVRMAMSKFEILQNDSGIITNRTVYR